MTTGRRVAQKRKELGISQEALGERLGVSRQSIYKWESDSALPEVEKLVALSRLFGVSVGWLLGVEEAPAPGGAELTEAQVNMVEEIAARYAPKPRLSAQRMAVVKLSVAAAAVCLCAVLFGFYRRLEDLSRNYSYLQSAITQVEAGVNSQIGGVSSRVEELLREQNAVTAGYGTSLEYVNLAGNRAKFSVYAVPKTFVEGMRAAFYAGGGGQRVIVSQGEDHRFEAGLYCDLEETITISVDFIYPDETRQNFIYPDETCQTQVLDRYVGLYGQTFPEARARYDLAFKPVENGAFSLAETQRECGHLDWDPEGTLPGLSKGELPEAELESVRVGLFRNKKLVDWAAFSTLPGVVEEETEVLTGEQWKALDKLRQNDGGGTRGYQWLNFHFTPQEVPVEAGDVFQIAVIMKDVYGRTAVRSGAAFGLDADWKELTALDVDPPDACPDGWMLADSSSICS